MTLLRPEDIRGGKVFYDFTTRIIYDNSRVHEDNEQMQFYEGKLNHIWVDLFIIDRLPESRFGAFFAKISSEGGVRHGHCPQGSDRLFQVQPGRQNPGGNAVRSRAAGSQCRRCSASRQPVAAKDRNKRTGKRYCSNYQPDFLYVTLDEDWCEKDGGSAL